MVTVVLLIIRFVLLRFKNLAKTWPTVFVNVMGQDVSFKRSHKILVGYHLGMCRSISLGMS